MIVELMVMTPNAIKLIELAGRTSYKSFDKISENSGEVFVRRLIDMGHLSVLEHAYATFKIKGISRSCSHQLVRHRLCSFTQQSQRYVSAKDFEYATPYSLHDNEEGSHIFRRAMSNAKEAYKNLINLKIPWEDARAVLPNATTTEIVISANFRQWRHVIKMRQDPAAQYEIMDLTRRILKILTDHYPTIFSDLKARED